MAKRRQLKLGHMIEGAGRTWTDWRHPDAQPDASTDFGLLQPRRQAGRARQVRLPVHRRQPLDQRQVQPALPEPLRALHHPVGPGGGDLEHIGLVAHPDASPIASPSTSPASSPRSTTSAAAAPAGTWSPPGWRASAENFGKDEHLAHDVRYRLAAEYLDVVQGLWDSWEDDALVHDKASGVFFDPGQAQHAWTTRASSCR